MKAHLNLNPYLRRIVLGVAATAVISFTLPSVHAAPLTWDTVAEDGATITAGSGTWDTTAGNTIWNNAGANAPWTQTSAAIGVNNAVFAGTDGAYTITLATNLASAAGLTFSNSGYTLTAVSAQTLNVNGTGAVATIAAGKTATIGSNVTVAFNNGGTIQNSGTRFSLGAGSNLKIAAGGTLTRTVAPATTTGSGTDGTIGFVGSGIVDIAGTFSNSAAGQGTRGGILLATTAADAIIVNVNSGGLVQSTISGNGLLMTNNATATATLNLNTGGTVFVRKVSEVSGTSNFNFDGGTLRASAASTTFMTGLDSAAVKAGGATIDSNGFDITVGQALTHDTALGVTPDGGLVKSGAGTLTLTGASTYTGATNVSAGTLLVNGSLGNTAVSVASGATIGGDGVIGGSLNLASGALFAFEETATLTANGSTVTFGGLGIANLFGLDSTTANGTYTLIDGTSTIDFANVSNIGAANAFNLGNGQSAYFQQGSLQVVVIPEPASALLGGLGLLALLRRRRA